MPTNDERREVAARLREHAKTARRVGYACVLKNCTSEEECDGFGIEGCAGCFNRSLNRLAELIEPDPECECQIIEEEPLVFICSKCGGELEDWYLACPYCGCKVVEQ